MKKKLKFIGSGAECNVYDLGNGKVYKKYKDWNNKRDLSEIYRRAKKAAKYGVGPVVFYKREHGYVTEKVGCPARPYSNEFDELESKAKKLGFFTNDFHPWNIGRKTDKRTGKSKLVMIDFGPLSS